MRPHSLSRSPSSAALRVVSREGSALRCPLCRQSINERDGQACWTCGAVAHLACLGEFGGCHPAPASPPVAPARPGAEPQQPTPRTLGGWPYGWIAAGIGTVVAGAVRVLTLSGLQAALLFVLFVGMFGLWATWILEGLVTQKIQSLGGATRIDYRQYPLDYLIHLALYLPPAIFMACFLARALVGPIS